MSPHVLCVLSRFSHVPLFVTLQTIAHQGPLSTGFSKQEYWTGLTCPPPGDLPDSGIEPASPGSPALQVDSLLLSHQVSTWEPLFWFKYSFFWSRLRTQSPNLILKIVHGTVCICEWMDSYKSLRYQINFLNHYYHTIMSLLKNQVLSLSRGLQGLL